jgi:hypothetical protein
LPNNHGRKKIKVEDSQPSGRRFEFRTIYRTVGGAIMS